MELRQAGRHEKERKEQSSGLGKVLSYFSFL
jgi:hypothetical protein